MGAEVLLLDKILNSKFQKGLRHSAMMQSVKLYISFQLYADITVGWQVCQWLPAQWWQTSRASTWTDSSPNYKPLGPSKGPWWVLVYIFERSTGSKTPQRPLGASIRYSWKLELEDEKHLPSSWHNVTPETSLECLQNLILFLIFMKAN